MVHANVVRASCFGLTKKIAECIISRPLHAGFFEVSFYNFLPKCPTQYRIMLLFFHIKASLSLNTITSLWLTFQITFLYDEEHLTGKTGGCGLRRSWSDAWIRVPFTEWTTKTLPPILFNIGNVKNQNDQRESTWIPPSEGLVNLSAIAVQNG